jgi:hypothetical protein
VQNVVPVTIRQVLESHEAGLKIGNLDVHIVRMKFWLYNFMPSCHA